MRRDGDEAAAMQWYDRGIELDRGFAAIWYLRGELHERRGAAREAAAGYAAAFAADPRFYPAALSLAAAHERLGDVPAAISILERALGALPEQQDLARRLGELRRRPTSR